MNIRRATPDDSSLLSSLCMDVQNLHAQNRPDDFKMPQSPEFAVPFFDKLLADEAMFIFIVEEKGDALGYVFFKMVDKPENPFLFARHYVLIDQISVRPEAQGKGVGKMLMNQVDKIAQDLGVKNVHLGSWDFNTNAHGFFEKAGYHKRYFEFWKKVD